MKKSHQLTILAASMALATGNVFADTAGDAMAHVAVTVDPNIAVSTSEVAQMSPVQSGPFGTSIIFRVDANEEAVTLGVTSTHLYKGNDPTLDEVTPLPVDVGYGAHIMPAHANPMNGGSNVGVYGDEITVETPNGTMMGHRTNDIAFESSQNGHFSQDVMVDTGWVQDDPEKPQGEYSGYVILHTALLGAATPG